MPVDELLKMTLLEATATLIDCAKTWAPDDPIVKRAVRRMERRLEVLQLRAANARRLRRHKAWVALQSFRPVCDCGHRFIFGEFAGAAVLTGHGNIKRYHCPKCSKLVVGLAEQ